MDSFFCWRVKAGKGSGLRANHYHLQSAGAANVPGFLLRHSCSPWRHHGQRVRDPTLDPGRQWVSGIGDQSSPFSPPWRDCQWSRTREDWGYWARLTSRRSAPEAINKPMGLVFPGEHLRENHLFSHMFLGFLYILHHFPWNQCNGRWGGELACLRNMWNMAMFHHSSWLSI